MSSRVMALGCRSETMPFDYRMARTLKGEGHAVLDGLRVLHAIHEKNAGAHVLGAEAYGGRSPRRLQRRVGDALGTCRAVRALSQLMRLQQERRAVGRCSSCARCHAYRASHEYNVTPWLCRRTSRAFFGRAALVASRIPSSLRCRSASRSEPRAPHLSAHSEQPSLTERLDIGVGGSDPGILRVHPHD